MINVKSRVFCRKKCTVPQNRKSHGFSRTKHHIPRQIRILISQTVRRPSPHTRHSWRHRPVVHQQQCWTMVRVVRVTRAQYTQVIGVLRRHRQKLADWQFALPMICVFIRHLHQAACRAFRSQISAIGTLPCVFRQRRLGIKKVRTKRPTVHEKVNHPLRSRREMGLCQNSAILAQRGNHSKRTKPTAD